MSHARFHACQILLAAAIAVDAYLLTLVIHQPPVISPMGEIFLSPAQTLCCYAGGIFIGLLIELYDRRRMAAATEQARPQLEPAGQAR